MATIQLAAYRGITTVMTTELDSLAATSGKAISSAIDNSSNLDLFDDLELVVTFATGPTADTMIEVYLVPSIDGTNYADASTTVLAQAGLYVGGFSVRNTTTLQRRMIRGVPLPPGLFKYQIQNTTNQAFPASGSTLKRNSYQLKTL